MTEIAESIALITAALHRAGALALVVARREENPPERRWTANIRTKAGLSTIFAGQTPDIALSKLLASLEPS